MARLFSGVVRLMTRSSTANISPAVREVLRKPTTSRIGSNRLVTLPQMAPIVRTNIVDKFHLAVKNERVDLMKSLMKEYPEVIDAASSVGMTAMMDAFWREHVTGMALLRRFGVNMDIQTWRGTALHFAIDYLDWNKTMPHFMELLLLCGANPNIPDQKLNTPFHQLVQHNAASPRLVRAFLASGGNAQAKDQDDHTVLFLASPEMKEVITTFSKQAYDPPVNVIDQFIEQ